MIADPTRSPALAVLGLVVLLSPGELAGQQFGRLFGAVTDEEGGPLAGAAVTLEGMGAPRVALTDPQGEFRFLALDPGTYSVGARLDGFSAVETPNAEVLLNRTTTVHLTLVRAVEEEITVIDEPPLLDERQVTQGTVLGRRHLDRVPAVRDPWALLNQTPGVLVAWFNVGGSESGNQGIMRGLGVTSDENDFLLDGVQITDSAAVGASTIEPSLDQLEAVEISTGGADVTKSTAGVAINMVTRRGTNELRGSAQMWFAEGDGPGFLDQSSSGFDCADLGPNQSCAEFVPASIDGTEEYSVEVGGPAIVDRVWLWGSYSDRDIDRVAVGGIPVGRSYQDVWLKANAQLAPNNSAVTSWNSLEKEGLFGAGPDRSPETTWDVKVPTEFWRIDDTHVFGPSVFLAGSYQKTDYGFDLRARSGCLDRSCPVTQEALLDSDGVWKQNFFSGSTRRPAEAVRIDSSYFFTTGALRHELESGGRHRRTETDDAYGWPGRGLAHIAGENFGLPPGPIDFFLVTRQAQHAPVEVDYTSLWLQDTIAAGRWTLALGGRYDLQEGTNRPGSTGPSPVPEILPEVSLDAPLNAGFEWETVTPRLGLTYALGDDHDTLLRASYSRFPEVLGSRDVSWTSPLAGSSDGFFLFTDLSGDNLFQEDEPFFFLFGSGFDPANPTANLNTVDPGLDPEIISEAVVGVEHALRPDLVVRGHYTWREVDDVKEVRDYVRPVGTSGAGRLATADDYVPDGTTSATLPDGTEAEVELFALDPALEFTGFGHLMNGSRSREYNGATLSLEKRLVDRWALRGFVNWGETEWDVPADYLRNSDPNDDAGGADNDGALFSQVVSQGLVAIRDSFLQASWGWSLAGLYRVDPERRWGFDLAANLYGREGYLLPYYNSVLGSDGKVRSISLVGADVDRFRTDDVALVDLRLQKTVSPVDHLELVVTLDLFNALNEATVVSREVALTGGTANNVQDVVAPRVFRLGLGLSWK